MMFKLLGGGIRGNSHHFLYLIPIRAFWLYCPIGKDQPDSLHALHRARVDGFSCGIHEQVPGCISSLLRFLSGKSLEELADVVLVLADLVHASFEHNC